MYKKIINTFTLTILSLSIVACSSNEDITINEEPAVAPTSLNPQMKPRLVNTRDAVIQPDSDIRRGAAIEEGSRKHYLAKDSFDTSPLIKNNMKYDRRNNASYANMINASNSNKDTSFISDNFKLGKLSDYSYYNLSRWQRFCNKGKGMDRLDWKFVKNPNNLFPAELLEKCNAPSRALFKRYGMKIED